MALVFTLLSVFLIVPHWCTYDTSSSLNEFDTYNADECQRIRRPWHQLSAEERDLYASGLLQLRQKGNGNLDDDELISIGSVHEDTTAFMHQTSAYLFWHGYLVWELESRIRNLGGKWKCFGMPYWDFTLESGRETHPHILESAELGGNGDPDDFWRVNGFSWSPTTSEYWVPNNCVSSGDSYPLCSLKRALRADFVMPSAERMGEVIMNNADFLGFAEYSHESASAIHLLDAAPDDMDGFPQAYEPIWYLYHAGIQYHQALWTDCNDYDLINPNDLDNHPEAFTSFCNSPSSCDTFAYPQDSTWYGTQFGLDDLLHFGGVLGEKTWSYANRYGLTVRELYHIPRWNIVYDTGGVDGFFGNSGMNEYCEGKMNRHWFLLDGVKDAVVDEVVIGGDRGRGTKLSESEQRYVMKVCAYVLAGSGIAIVVVGVLWQLWIKVCEAGRLEQTQRAGERKRMVDRVTQSVYGSVM